jgi:hypothetical protein
MWYEALQSQLVHTYWSQSSWMRAACMFMTYTLWMKLIDVQGSTEWTNDLSDSNAHNIEFLPVHQTTLHSSCPFIRSFICLSFCLPKNECIIPSSNTYVLPVLILSTK